MIRNITIMMIHINKSAIIAQKNIYAVRNLITFKCKQLAKHMSIQKLRFV